MAKTFLNLDIDFTAVNIFSIVAPLYISAYTYYFFRAWLYKYELSWTPYLGESLIIINWELHLWNLMPWYEQDMSFFHQLHSKSIKKYFYKRLILNEVNALKGLVS